MRRFPFRTPAALLLILVTAFVCSASARTIRLFAIGNSFSQNATSFLPQVVKSGGHELVFATAQTGGCTLEKHWKAVEADLANPGDPKARIYSGKTLRELLGTGTWEIITIQQASILSGDPETYRPYAQKLRDYIHSLQPQAEIVLHQTWAYRLDADSFGFISAEKKAATEKEMWEHSRAAYHAIAAELKLRIIPNGDAFWKIDSNPEWSFRVDPAFDAKKAKAPSLPNETHSIHRGYSWTAEQKLVCDTHHAGVAGRYLGGLVWYAFLFKESPENLTFVPPEVPADFAAYLRRVAAEVTCPAALAAR